MTEKQEMANQQRADRIKSILLENHTYEEMERRTGISKSTLVRIATNKTDPKATDLEKIAQATGKSMDWICFGDILEIKRNAQKEFAEALDGGDSETTDAHNFIIWNLRTLTKRDIQTVSKIVDALSNHNYMTQKGKRDMAWLLDKEE